MSLARLNRSPVRDKARYYPWPLSKLMTRIDLKGAPRAAAYIREGTMAQPRAADDFAAIRARMEELKREREQPERSEDADFESWREQLRARISTARVNRPRQT